MIEKGEVYGASAGKVNRHVTSTCCGCKGVSGSVAVEDGECVVAIEVPVKLERKVESGRGLWRDDDERRDERRRGRVRDTWRGVEDREGEVRCAGEIAGGESGFKLGDDGR